MQSPDCIEEIFQFLKIHYIISLTDRIMHHIFLLSKIKDSKLIITVIQNHNCIETYAPISLCSGNFMILPHNKNINIRDETHRTLSSSGPK